MEDTIVLYPCPGASHLFSMVELGKLILKHHSSISITIIMSTLPHQPISAHDPYISKVSATTPSITFIHLPTISSPPVISSSPRDFVASFFELAQLNSNDLHQALLTLSKSSNLKAVVIDFFCNYAFQVSSSLNIPTYYFYPSGSSGVSVFLYLPTIHKNITKSLKDVDILLDVPGVPKISSKDMPLPSLDPSHKVYWYFLDTASQMVKSAGVIINTFESLEPRALEAILEGKCTPSEPVPPMYCVGPVVSSSESKDDHECLTWLDSQPSHSVVFLCFGSLGAFSASQLKEIAIGLEKSGVRFLWVVRNPLADDETQLGSALTPTEPSFDSFLPDGFLNRTKERGFVVKQWAPQVAVLNHGSVGGFVTHCGWNSVLEAVCAGVPMLAWPLYAEQKLNRIFLVEEMKVGLAVTESENGFVSATELEQRVRELMNPEKGQAVRERVMAMREDAAAAMSDGGSSRVAMTKLMDSLKQSSPVPHLNHQ